MHNDLVAGRECGSCTLCCSVLKIDEPEFRKHSGDTCQHCAPERGCTIYETRFTVCRSWFCGYRTLDWIDASMRPDETGVLVFRGGGTAPDGFDPLLALNFLILSHAALRSPVVLGAIGRSIVAGRATQMVVPGPTGRPPCVYLVNDLLAGVDPARHQGVLQRELKKIYLGFVLLAEQDVGPRVGFGRSNATVGAASAASAP